ncbi:MAG: hypothetical protein AABZ80_03505 [Gemmatimonadota bacterium]
MLALPQFRVVREYPHGGLARALVQRLIPQRALPTVRQFNWRKQFGDEWVLRVT